MSPRYDLQDNPRDKLISQIFILAMEIAPSVAASLGLDDSDELASEATKRCVSKLFIYDKSRPLRPWVAGYVHRTALELSPWRKSSRSHQPLDGTETYHEQVARVSLADDPASLRDESDAAVETFLLSQRETWRDEKNHALDDARDATRSGYTKDADLCFRRAALYDILSEQKPASLVIPWRVVCCDQQPADLATVHKVSENAIHQVVSRFRQKVRARAAWMAQNVSSN